MNGTGQYLSLVCCGGSCQPPTVDGDDRPDGFQQPERPSALKKPVRRAKHTRTGECQQEYVVAPLERVAH
jgi:hypothetical protein